MAIKKRDRKRKEKRQLIRKDVYSDGEDEVDHSRLDNVQDNQYHIEHINKNDDEEIDEDEAFNSQDEAKFGEYFTNSKKKSVDDASNSEQEESQDEEDDENMMDISDLLGQMTSKPSANNHDDSDSQMQQDHLYKSTLSTLMSGQKSDDEDDDEFASLSSEDEEMMEQDDNLVDFVSNLATKSATKSRKRSRKSLQEVTEAFNESEYNLSSHNYSSKHAVDSDDDQEQHPIKKKLNLSDLTGVLKETSGFVGLKKQLENLESTKAKAKTIDIPLPKRAVDKLDREAAYEKAKKEVNKWAPLIQKNRMADHLTFNTNEPSPINLSSGELVGKFQASNSLETEIQDILEKANLSEKRQAQIEQLEMNKVSAEEIAVRRTELAKMRSMLFFQEQKNKKISKIKSKTYRKLKRKDERNQEELDMETLKELDPEAAKEKLMKIEFERAKERMTMKHKNSGKWAKRMLSKKDIDNETRQALMAQLNKHDELKKKIRGDDDSSSSEEEPEDDSMITTAAIEKLEEMNQSIDQTKVPDKGVFAMKFMKRDIEKQKLESKKSVDKLLGRLKDGLSDDEDISDFDEDEMDDGGVKKLGAGRSVYDKSKTKKEQEEFSDSDGEDNKYEHTIKMSAPLNVLSESGETKRLAPLFEVESFQDEPGFKGSANSTIITKETTLPNKKGASRTIDDDEPDSNEEEVSVDSSSDEKMISKPVESESEDENQDSNPWLKPSTKPLMKTLRESTSITPFARVGKQVKSLEKLARAKKARNDGREETNEVEDDDDLVVQQPLIEEKKPLVVLSDSDSDSEIDQSKNNGMVHKKDINQLSKIDVMKLAFAEDEDLMDEFEQEKSELIERDIPKVEDTCLPGWGDWSGNGIRPKKKKEKVAKAPIVTKKSVEDKRKDKNLKNVIINEKRSKQAIKYMLPKLPHGFETREQYEKTIRVPLGKEWHTSATHQKLIKPKVKVQAGVVIHPMKFSVGK